MKSLTKYYLLFLIFFGFTYNNLLAVHSHKYYLTVCTIFNNDAPWLKEWIEYYKLLGVEHFYLYNNESSDDFLTVLKPYIKKGDVTLIHWQDRHNLEEPLSWVIKTQCTAYADAIDKFKTKTRWMAIIDSDEFIVPKEKDNLIDFLKEYDDQQIGAIAINWSMYGTSHVWDIPQNRLMIECLTRKGTDDEYWSYSGKCIVKPKHVIEVPSPHYFILADNKVTLTPNRGIFTPFKTKAMEKIKINHYYTRTFNFFYNQKIPRKMRMENILLSEADIRYLLDLGDQVEDDEKDISRFIPKLRKVLKLDD